MHSSILIFKFRYLSVSKIDNYIKCYLSYKIIKLPIWGIEVILIMLRDPRFFLTV